MALHNTWECRGGLTSIGKTGTALVLHWAVPQTNFYSVRWEDNVQLQCLIMKKNGHKLDQLQVNAGISYWACYSTETPSYWRLPVLILPLPPIRLNICKSFPLKSMRWPPLPSHLYYFNSRQVFSIREGTDWHVTHCYMVLHGQKAVLCSLAFEWLRGPLWAELQIFGLRPVDHFRLTPDGH